MMLNSVAISVWKSANAGWGAMIVRPRCKAYRGRTAGIVIAYSLASLLLGCDMSNSQGRAAAARIETLETEKRLILETAARHERELAAVLGRDQSAETELQSIALERESLLASDPLLAASLQGVAEAADNYEQSQTTQQQMDDSAVLTGLLSGAYLALNHEEAARAVTAMSNLEERKQLLTEQRAAIARDIDVQRAAIESCNQRREAIERQLEEERARL